MPLSFFLSLSLSLNTHKSFWDFHNLISWAWVQDHLMTNCISRTPQRAASSHGQKSLTLCPTPYSLNLRMGQQAPGQYPTPTLSYLGWWAGLQRTTEVPFFHPGVNPQTGSGPHPFPSYPQCCRRCLKGDTDRLFDFALILFGMLFTTRKTDVGESRKSTTVTNTVSPMNKQWLKRGRKPPSQYGRRYYGKE